VTPAALRAVATTSFATPAALRAVGTVAAASAVLTAGTLSAALAVLGGSVVASVPAVARPLVGVDPQLAAAEGRPSHGLKLLVAAVTGVG
ncbi:hypothetical protein Q604_UNBC03707G0001, partial [human gut metagenome]